MQETRQFTIAATGKAFRNLMDGLYSRKIEAFCREILTNAYDSHCEAGKRDVLFRVTIPTIFDKRLIVRDYGIGMVHEQVMDKYSQLFNSTKDQTDDLVGMLGLGSKSPFAYTDGFSLRCWDGEECRTYSAYLGEGGVPQISLAARVPSDEPRGVEVGIPIKQQDFSAVISSLARVCLGFEFPPELPPSVTEQMVWKDHASGSGWAIGECPALKKGLWARQGCVLYPIPIEIANKTVTGWKEEGKIDATIVVDFQLGELEVTPSRETLSMTDKTKEAIAKRLEHFLTEISTVVEERFPPELTKWEVTRRFVKLKGEHIPQTILSNTAQARIHSEIYSNFRDVLYRPRGSQYSARWTLVELIDSEHRWRYRKHGAKEYEHNGLFYQVTNAMDSYHIRRLDLPETEKDLAFVVDLDNSNAKIACWLQDQGIKRALILRKGPGDYDGEYKEFNRADSANPKLLWSKKLKDFTEDDLLRMPHLKSLGDPPVVRGSTIPKPPKIERPKAKVEAGRVLNSETGSFEIVDKAELKALQTTHEFLYYNKAREAILEPRGDVPAGEWRTQMTMGYNLKIMLENIKVITGKTPKLALVKVTPSTTYDSVRQYKLMTQKPADILVEQAPPEFWEETVPLVIYQQMGLRNYLREDPWFADMLKQCANPNLRRLGRLLENQLAQEKKRDAEEKKSPGEFGNERYYADRRRSLLEDLFTKSDAVRRRFLEEARRQDYRVRINRPDEIWTGGQDWISPRWEQFIKMVNTVFNHQKGLPNHLRSEYFRALELAELEVQKKGGHKCRS